MIAPPFPPSPPPPSATKSDFVLTSSSPSFCVSDGGAFSRAGWQPDAGGVMGQGAGGGWGGWVWVWGGKGELKLKKNDAEPVSTLHVLSSKSAPIRRGEHLRLLLQILSHCAASSREAIRLPAPSVCLPPSFPLRARVRVRLRRLTSRCSGITGR